MITITPTAQLSVVDSSTNPSTNLPVASGGATIQCPTGALIQDVDLAASTVDAAPAFPIGVTVAKAVYILPVTVTDLIVSVGVAGAADLAVPLGQPLILYNVAVAELLISSALGGKIQVTIGG